MIGCSSGVDSIPVRSDDQGSSPGRWAGFTLIELLTVIAIIGILAAILIPVVGRVRDSAKTAQARSNVSQIGMTMHLYIEENNEQLPTDMFGAATGTPPWIQALWAISNSGEEFPEFGAAIHGNVFRDTIYHTPLMEDVASNGQLPRSFGWSAALRVNSVGSFSGRNDRARLSAIDNPSQTAVLADSMSSSVIQFPLGNTGQINYRNNGKALFLFVDGHVELLGPDQVPSSHNHVFWGGNQTEAATPRR